jgi:sugar phosphate permease
VPRASRLSLLAVLFCTYLLCYMDRMAIATAIPFIAQDFHLSPFAMGGVLSAFFIGYAAMQIPGGLLADKFGPRRVMTVSIAAWSVFTALTGAVTSLPILLGIRILFGMAEGPYPPSASKAITLCFPQNEVGRANGIQMASVNIGAAIAPLVVAPITVTVGWRWVFFGLLVPGLVIALIIFRFLGAGVDGLRDVSPSSETVGRRIRLKDAVKMPALIWCCITVFFANTASWGLMNWLPTYLLQARGFGVVRTGVFASFPFVAGALGYFLGGYLSDTYFRDRRHIPITMGLLASGGLTYLAAIAPTGEWTIAALAAVFLCLFIALGGIFTLPLVLVPSEAVGGVFGIVNTVGQVAAFLSPLLIGYLLDVTDKNFTWVFYCLVGLFLVSSCSATRIRVRPSGAERVALSSLS